LLDRFLQFLPHLKVDPVDDGDDPNVNCAIA